MLLHKYINKRTVAKYSVPTIYGFDAAYIYAIYGMDSPFCNGPSFSDIY